MAGGSAAQCHHCEVDHILTLLAPTVAVVFLSFYQGLLISALVFFNVIKPTLEYTQEEVAKGLQDFIIVIEMGFAAVAHHFAFGYADFLRPDLAAELHMDRDAEGRVIAHHHGVGRALKDLLPLDVVKDTGSHIARGFGRMRSQQSGLTLPAGNGSNNAPAPLGVPVPIPTNAAAAGATTSATATAAVLEMRDSPRHSTAADSAAVAAAAASLQLAASASGDATAAATAALLPAAPRTPSASLRGAGVTSGAAAVPIAATDADAAAAAAAAPSPGAVAILNPLAAAATAASPALGPDAARAQAQAQAHTAAAEWR